ncbi:MAG: hypothetical protein RLZZ153_1680, partial [Pseudomonadota bacterium]
RIPERTGAYRRAPELSNPTQRQRTGAYRHAPEPTTPNEALTAARSAPHVKSRVFVT